MRFVNLTPHDLTVVDALGIERVLPAVKGRVARVIMTPAPAPTLLEDEQGNLFSLTEAGQPVSVEGLPDQEHGVLLVVSAIVRSCPLLAGRGDLVSPDTGPSALRDALGQIRAVKGFVK